MTGLTLTCDRQDGLCRAAVWVGKELRDLYLDRLDRPDLTGAVVGARVTRLAQGQKAAWCDGNLGSSIYVEKPGMVRSGDYLTLRIMSSARQGKAWGGVPVDFPSTNGQAGILASPPPSWERALRDLNNEIITSISLDHGDDLVACRRWLEVNNPASLFALKTLAKEPVHPELDDIIARLCDPVVPLQGGGNIVIEETEALVALDVNGGEASNALAINLRAVKEAARQIRWRNLSGIIVIDALKMKARPDNAKVINAFEKAIATDPLEAHIWGMTKLGLIEMTRKRRGASVASFFKDL